MNTTISEGRYPTPIRGATDGSVAGTRFYNSVTGVELIPSDVTVQQEGMSTVRIRFASHYAIPSFVMGPDDTLTVNV